jgi:hypothetical protein
VGRAAQRVWRAASGRGPAGAARRDAARRRDTYASRPNCARSRGRTRAAAAAIALARARALRITRRCAAAARGHALTQHSPCVPLRSAPACYFGGKELSKDLSDKECCKCHMVVDRKARRPWGARGAKRL